jgi:hypothetical protein
MGQVQAHDAVVGLQQRGVHGKVGGGAAQGLHVDAPLLGGQAKQVQGAALTQQLRLVNVLIAAIVPGWVGKHEGWKSERGGGRAEGWVVRVGWRGHGEGCGGCRVAGGLGAHACPMITAGTPVLLLV